MAQVVLIYVTSGTRIWQRWYYSMAINNTVSSTGNFAVSRHDRVRKGITRYVYHFSYVEAVENKKLNTLCHEDLDKSMKGEGV